MGGLPQTIHGMTRGRETISGQGLLMWLCKEGFNVSKSVVSVVLTGSMLGSISNKERKKKWEKISSSLTLQTEDSILPIHNMFTINKKNQSLLLQLAD